MRRTWAIGALVVVLGLVAASIALASGRDHGNGEHGKGRL